MEILGIGPGEFVLILIVLLVVVGPERLPGLARQAAGVLVRVRNWLQTSPDAALVLRARQEIEAELASLRSGLLEVQNVRDEVLGAAKQLEDSVGSIASTKFDVNSLINPPAGQTIARGQPDTTAVPNDQLILPDGTPADPSVPHAPTTIELPDGTTKVVAQPAEEKPANGIVRPSLRQTPAALPQAELESINTRLQAIMADMWALQTQLKQRGVLDDAWQPPSLNVQLPEQTPEPAAPAVAAEPLPIVDPYPPMATHIHTPPVVVTPPISDAEAESQLLASAAEYVALYEDPVAVAAETGTPDVTNAAEAPVEMPVDAETEAPLLASVAEDVVLYEDTVAEAAELSTPDATNVVEVPTDVLADAKTETSLPASAAEDVADAAESGTPDTDESLIDSELATTTNQTLADEIDALQAAKMSKRQARADAEQTEDRETVATEEAS